MGLHLAHQVHHLGRPRPPHLGRLPARDAGQYRKAEAGPLRRPQDHALGVDQRGLLRQHRKGHRPAFDNADRQAVRPQARNRSAPHPVDGHQVAPPLGQRRKVDATTDIAREHACDIFSGRVLEAGQAEARARQDEMGVAGQELVDLIGSGNHGQNAGAGPRPDEYPAEPDAPAGARFGLCAHAPRHGRLRVHAWILGHIEFELRSLSRRHLNTPPASARGCARPPARRSPRPA